MDTVPRGVRWLHLNSFSLSIDGNRLSCRNDALDVKTSHAEFFGKVHWLTTEKLPKLQAECQNLFLNLYLHVFGLLTWLWTHSASHFCRCLKLILMKHAALRSLKHSFELKMFLWVKNESFISNQLRTRKFASQKCKVIKILHQLPTFIPVGRTWQIIRTQTDSLPTLHTQFANCL